MLNGIDPILMFYKLEKDAKGINKPTGIPIPIYLDERFTNIIVDGESESLSIETETIAGVNDNQLEIIQKGLTQKVSIELVMPADSPIINVLMAMLKTVGEWVNNKQDYYIAYFHKNVLIFNSKLAGYDKKQGRNDNLFYLTIELEIKPPKEEPKKIETPLANEGGPLETVVEKPLPLNPSKEPQTMLRQAVKNPVTGQTKSYLYKPVIERKEVFG